MEGGTKASRRAGPPWIHSANASFLSVEAARSRRSASIGSAEPREWLPINDDIERVAKDKGVLDAHQAYSSSTARKRVAVRFVLSSRVRVMKKFHMLCGMARIKRTKYQNMKKQSQKETKIKINIPS